MQGKAHSLLREARVCERGAFADPPTVTRYRIRFVSHSKNNEKRCIRKLRGTIIFLCETDLREFSEVLDGSDHLAGVAVFVVVPGNDLYLDRCRRRA